MHRFTQEQANHATFISLDLLHKHLGHPSFAALAKFDKTIWNSVNFDSLPSTCTICLQAKQTRHSFPLSDFRLCDMFELIHCNIWGPY